MGSCFRLSAAAVTRERWSRRMDSSSFTSSNSYAISPLYVILFALNRLNYFQSRVSFLKKSYVYGTGKS